MALTSPGVQVSVVDESFYTPAEPGTRPLIIVASASNKTNAAGTGTAQGTLPRNAGKVYNITSQRELADIFGDPVFRVDNNNNPIHAGELNEYGLQAAYSFLGIANSVLIARADIDLDALNPQADAPGGEPQNGTFWLDTSTTAWGIFEWNGAAASTRNGQSFQAKTPVIILEASQLISSVPKASVGRIGDYAVAVGTDDITVAELDNNTSNVDEATNHEIYMFYKNRSNAWVKIGSPEWVASHPTVVSSAVNTTTWTAGDYELELFIDGATQSVTVDLTNATNFTQVAAAIIDTQTDVTASFTNGVLEIFYNGSSLQFGGTLVTDQTLNLGINPARVYYTPALTIAKHTQVPSYRLRDANPRPTGSVWIKITEPNAGARWRLKVYNENTELWDAVDAPIYPNSHSALAEVDPSGGGLNVPINSAYVEYNFNQYAPQQAEFRVLRRFRAGETIVKSTPITSAGITPAGTYSIQMAESLVGSANLNAKRVDITVQGNVLDSEKIAEKINAAGFTNITATVDSTNRVVITHLRGGEIRFADFGDSTEFVGTKLKFDTENSNVYRVREAGPAGIGGSGIAIGQGTYQYVGSNWIPMTIVPDTSTAIRQSFYISNNNPETLVADGTLWYSSIVNEVDIMIHNGNTWVGYQRYDHGRGVGLTNPTGPIVSATAPTTQSDGTLLEEGDLWISTSSLDDYPSVNRYDFEGKRWVLLDKSDQTTENGILFADARWNKDGKTAEPASIQELLTINFLDFDAPDPALYPRGMLLWNLRRSGFNVKKFKKNYIPLLDDNIRYNTAQSEELGQTPTSGEKMETYYPHRWVTESGNQNDGSGSFGRFAQRKVIQQSLQALVNSNQEIRDTERNTFNLLACPGYPELIGEMIILNNDRGLTSFIVGDTPARLTPDATTLNNWGTNAALALEDNEKGLVSSDEYLGVFYPWGFTSDNAGRDIIIPPSHMIMRMMALSDNVSYPWFAPAGTRRGGITNATAVGYLDKAGEFQSVALNEGQRDTLYTNKINPITFFVGAGLVNFGQKTRARNASALDRINVARLVIYLRSQLNKLAKPYIFEPNDKTTRDEIKQQVESLLVELVGLRALFDFLVVCDESNNTPNRIDRNELYVDIAIEPVKAVEFIYIPVRLKNTGEIAGL
jgi:Phage tail sheath C-terminal domain